MEALIAWRRAVETTSPAEIMAGLEKYAFKDDPRYVATPAAWLNKRRWIPAEFTPRIAASRADVDPYAHLDNLVGTYPVNNVIPAGMMLGVRGTLVLKSVNVSGAM